MRLALPLSLFFVFLQLALFSPAASAQARRSALAEAAPAAKKEEAVSEAYAFAERLSALLDAGDFAAAISSFDALPKGMASSPEMLKLKLSILISSGNTAAASALANSIEAQHGTDAELLYARAVIALAENKPQERSRRLREILELDPKNMDALLALGDDSLARRAYAEAASWYSRALSASRGNVDAYRGLAHSHYLQGRMRDAKRVIDRAIAENPQDASLLAESALIYFEERNLPKALETMRLAISLAPAEPSYWSSYGVMLLNASRLPEARDALTEAIRLNPADAFPYIYRCSVNDTLGYADEAISDYRVVCKSFPQYYFAAEGLGALLWLRGDFEGARAAFSQALQYNEGSFSYALMYTLCCYRLKENEAAKQFIGRFMRRLDRSSPEYFVCRLFFDLSGDSDVAGRISRLSNGAQKSRLLFYLASYYDIFRSGSSLAGKLYAEIIASTQDAAFFEYRLASAAAERASQRAGLPPAGRAQ